MRINESAQSARDATSSVSFGFFCAVCYPRKGSVRFVYLLYSNIMAFAGLKLVLEGFAVPIHQ